MKASVISGSARARRPTSAHSRPSRRATDERPGYFRTIQNVQRTMIAPRGHQRPGGEGPVPQGARARSRLGPRAQPAQHDPDDHGLHAARGEAQRGQTCTRPGADDGVRGIHPGHTPYLNLDDWYSGMTMGRPSALYENGYPGGLQEHLADRRGLLRHAAGSGRTPSSRPQQTMRGKMALYGYLYGTRRRYPPSSYADRQQVRHRQRHGDAPHRAGINCGSDCSEAYASGTSVTLTAAAAGGSIFAGWSGACFGQRRLYGDDERGALGRRPPSTCRRQRARPTATTAAPGRSARPRRRGSRPRTSTPAARASPTTTRTPPTPEASTGLARAWTWRPPPTPAAATTLAGSPRASGSSTR